MSHHEFGPSTLPKLAKCIHFRGGKVAGEAASRGTMLHGQIAEILNFKGSPERAPQVEPEAIRGIDRLGKVMNDIKGIEQKFSLFGEGFIELTFGTIDAWGYWDDDEGGSTLVVADFKSGAMIAGPQAYTEQLAAYALMLMDAEVEDRCRVAIIPLDDPETDYHLASFTREEAEAIVLPIFERLKAGTEEPKENDGCNWCSRRETCEVWTKPAEAALTIVDALPATISREWIEASPQNAGVAKTAFKKLEAIFKDIGVDDRIREALQAGESVPGWKLQSRKGAERLDTKAVKTRWAELTDEPIPATIGEDTISLVAERGSK